MTRTPDEPCDEADLTALFEEYVALREADASGGVDALLERAGDRSESLRERIHVYGLLQELGCLIADDERGASEEAPAPERLGRFEIVRSIGEGGLSRVYLARDPVLERQLAIKVLRASPGDNTRASWIVSEGRKLARLEHDSIVRVLDVGEYEGRAFVAMEYVAGPTLAEALEALRHPASGPPAESGDGDERRALAASAAARLQTLGERTALVLELARALAYCHAQGVVHRDVKPGNVLIDADGTPRLIDFGLAKLDADDSLFVTDRLIGTPAYLAPEQVDSERTGASPASDQFSLGVVLYELLTLSNPFTRSGRSDTLTAISRAVVPPPRRVNRDLPVDLERICLHCLERTPERRYPTLDALVADLEAFLAHRAISLKAPSPVRRVGLFLQRHRTQVRIASAVLVTLVTLLSLGAVVRGRTERNALLQTLSALYASVDELSEPRQFEDAFALLAEARPLVTDYDAAWLSGTAFPELQPELDTTSGVVAQRFEDVLEPIYRKAHRNPGYRWRTQHYETASVLWKDAIARLSIALPDASNRFLPVGTVDPPPDGRLERYPSLFALPGLPRLEAVEPGRYLPGAYRYTRMVDGTVCQTEFWVNALMPRRTVTAEPADADALGLVDVEGATMPLAHGTNDPHEPVEASALALTDDEGTTPLALVYGPTYTVEPFRIGRAPVSWAEARAVLGAALEDRLGVQFELGTIRPSDPAVLPWCEAAEYARRVHARLPTAPELWQALRAGAIEEPRGLADSGVVYDREWATTLIELDRRYAFRYDDLRTDPPRPQFWGGDPQLDNDLVLSACFRIALSR